MKKIWVHRAKSFEDAERFDEQFWRRAGAAARLSATWLMVGEFLKLRGTYRGQPRLRRTVQHLKRAEELIKAKQAAGRPQDKLDLAKLQKSKRSGYR